jgi:uncharacterized membrane protein
MIITFGFYGDILVVIGMSWGIELIEPTKMDA